jgi:iron complex outermembrane receptor protein
MAAHRPRLDDESIVPLIQVFMKYMIGLWLVLTGFTLYGQGKPCNMVVNGVVTDEHSGEPLPFSEVLFLGQNLGTVADEQGRFRIGGLCAQRHQMVVRHVGCTPDTIELWIVGDTTIAILLEHHVELLQMLQIEADRPHSDIASRMVLSESQAFERGGSDLARLAETLPGVQSLQTGGNISKPMVRGLEGNRLSIVSDGVVLSSQSWGQEHAPEVNAFSLGELEVIKGASGLRFGPGAMGGALVLKSPEFHRDSVWNGQLRAGFNSNGRQPSIGLYLQGPLTKKVPLHAQIFASARASSDLKAPSYVLANTGFRDRNVQGSMGWFGKKLGLSLTYKLLETDLGILGYAHVGNLTDLNQILATGKPISPSEKVSWSLTDPKQHVEHETTTIKTWFVPRLGTKWVIQWSRQYNLRQEYDVSIYGNDAAYLQYELTSHGLDVFYERRFSERLKIEFGGTGNMRANTYEGRFFIPNYESIQGAVFGIAHWQWKSWEVEGGARWDRIRQQAFMYRSGALYSPELSFQGWSVNVGMSREFRYGDLGVLVGQSWRPPSVNELYSAGLHHGAAAIEYGDERIRDERQWSLGLDWKSDTVRMGAVKWQWTASAFAYYYDGFIYLHPDGTSEWTIRGAFPVYRYTAVEAVFRGGEVSSVLEWKQWFAHADGAWTLANERLHGDPLIFIPPFSGNATFGYRFSNRSIQQQVALTSHVVARKLDAPNEIDLAPAPPGYVLWGASWSLHISRPKRPIVLSFSLQNALNKSYRSYLNRLRYFAVEPGRMFNVYFQIPIR